MKRMLRLWGPPLILLSAALLLFFSGLLDEHPVFANFDSRNMKFESKRREAALKKGMTTALSPRKVRISIWIRESTA